MQGEKGIDGLMLADLPEPLRTYAETIGLDNLKKLAKRAGGKTIYIPTEECLDKYSLKRQIRRDCNRMNQKELEEKYGLSRSTIYRYLSE